MNFANPTPTNVYVNLDEPLPQALSLRVGQNLIFVRPFSAAGGPVLRSLTMPLPCFVTADDVPYSTEVQGQPARTAIVGLGLVHQVGSGFIVVQFESAAGGACRTVRLRFSISQG